MDSLLLSSIVVSTALLVLLSYKRVSVLISAPISTALLVIINQMDLDSSFFAMGASFFYYLSEFVLQFFLVFVLGAIMAKFLLVSKAIDRLKDFVLK